MLGTLPLVIIHRDRADRCLGTVEAFLAQDVPIEITIVDNGSSATSLAELRTGVPDGVEFVENGANLGFGPAANVGFRRFLARERADAGDWVAICPHDATPEPGCVRRLLEAASARPHAGLASADFDDGEVPVIDGYFGGILGPSTVEEGWEPADHPHGTLMIARRDCLDEVGLFDERYFAYCEEADLALRARAAGWEIGLVRGAIIRNPHVSSHIAVVDYLQLRNTLLLVREHFGRYHAFIRFVIGIWHLLAGLVAPSTRGPYYDAKARGLALVDHLRHRYGAPPASVAAR